MHIVLINIMSILTYFQVPILYPIPDVETMKSAKITDIGLSSEILSATFLWLKVRLHVVQITVTVVYVTVTQRNHTKQ